MFFDLHLTRRAKSQIPISKSQANLNRQIPKAAKPRIPRITRVWKNYIPNISAIRVIRGQAPQDLVLGIWDLLPQAVSMVENNLAGLNDCHSLVRSRVAPA